MTGAGRQEYLDAVTIGLTLEQLSAPIEADSGRVCSLASGRGRDRERAARSGDALLDRYVQPPAPTAVVVRDRDGARRDEAGRSRALRRRVARVAAELHDAARAVVARALEEARGFGHRYLGTEHLLLALTASRVSRGRRSRSSASARRRCATRSSGSSARPLRRLGGAWYHAPREARVRGGGQGGEARRSQRCADSEQSAARARREWGVARDILAEHDASDDALREHARRPLELEAPELAAKLRTPEASRRPPALAHLSRDAPRCSPVSALIERYVTTSSSTSGEDLMSASEWRARDRDTSPQRPVTIRALPRRGPGSAGPAGGRTCSFAAAAGPRGLRDIGPAVPRLRVSPAPPAGRSLRTSSSRLMRSTPRYRFTVRMRS